MTALRGKRLWQIPLTGKGGVRRPVPHLTGRYGRLRHAALQPSGQAL